jgi:hypothetical protein
LPGRTALIASVDQGVHTSAMVRIHAFLRGSNGDNC